MNFVPPLHNRHAALPYFQPPDSFWDNLPEHVVRNAKQLIAEAKGNRHKIQKIYESIDELREDGLIKREQE